MLNIILFHTIMKVQKHFDSAESSTILAPVSWEEPVCTTENIRISAQVVFPFLRCTLYDIRQTNRKDISIW